MFIDFPLQAAVRALRLTAAAPPLPSLSVHQVGRSAHMRLGITGAGEARAQAPLRESPLPDECQSVVLVLVVVHRCCHHGRNQGRRH